MGNEWGIVLDKAILQELKIGTKTVLEVTIEDDHLLVKPIEEEGDAWAEALKKTSEKYGDFLK